MKTALGPPFCPYSPECVEVEFSEVRIRYVGLASYDSPDVGLRPTCLAYIFAPLHCPQLSEEASLSPDDAARQLRRSG